MHLAGFCLVLAILCCCLCRARRRSKPKAGTKLKYAKPNPTVDMSMDNSQDIDLVCVPFPQKRGLVNIGEWNCLGAQCVSCVHMIWWWSSVLSCLSCLGIAAGTLSGTVYCCNSHIPARACVQRVCGFTLFVACCSRSCAGYGMGYRWPPENQKFTKTQKEEPKRHETGWSCAISRRCPLWQPGH